MSPKASDKYPVARGNEERAVVGRTPKRPDQDSLRRVLNEFMESRGLRSTEQRRLIVDSFFDAEGHETIDSLLESVRATDPHIGYATVYRTMKMLVESGVAHEQKFGDGFTRYELNDEETHHDHLICSVCGKIQEFEEPLIEDLQERVAARYGFDLQQHKLELYGVCADCRSKR